MRMPSFNVQSHQSIQPNMNLDNAALAAERRNLRHAGIDARFNTPTGLMQPTFNDPHRQQQQQQHQHDLLTAAQRRYEQHMRSSADADTSGAPARRMISFAPQNPHAHPVTYLEHALQQPSHDISISVSSMDSLPALSRPKASIQAAVQDQSVASYATSNFEDSTSASQAQAVIPSEPSKTAQFQKWDGKALTVPVWVVSNHAEDEVEECFETDAVERFDVAAIRARSQPRSGSSTVTEDLVDQDVLKGILETQLGLRTGLGWYGYTYRNPKKKSKPSATIEPAVPKHSGIGCKNTGTEAVFDNVDNTAGSRKRRRISSSPSPVGEQSETGEKTPSRAASDTEKPETDSESEEVDLIYDAFGRVRGTVPKMGYASRGGPRWPLPPPLETSALRLASARACVLRSYMRRTKQETRLFADLALIREQYTALHSRRQPTTQPGHPPAPTTSSTTIKSQAFYSQLKAKQRALGDMRAKHRSSMLKGLQNALLSAPSLTPLQQRISSHPSHDEI